MAGTDVDQPDAGDTGPVIILVEPQLGENIGMVARAMLNCGLLRLRLVRPRQAWPNERARRTASGADCVLEDCRIFQSTSDAIADLQRVFATTARDRDMTKQTLTPRAAATDMRSRELDGVRVGVLFGKEATGLDNEDVALADAIIAAPLNPDFSSLNLAMAVLLVGYEWRLAEAAAPASVVRMPKHTRPANGAEMAGMFAHLEGELDRCGFLRNVEKRPIMVRNLRNLFNRADLTEQEVRTLRGVITCLTTLRSGGSGRN